ncbi:hypothetical protein KAS79_02050 [Candidatus Parcubacteria bacterium]|nr:hypothetical protein [Candidatus Parcubacteria bacterium]
MDFSILNKISKNKYFTPILIGIIIALAGVLIGSSMNKENKEAGEEAESKTVELKEKKSLKGLLFGQKEFSLKYNDMDGSLVENISFFEAGENWQGHGFLDWRTFYQGKSSIGATSNNHSKEIIFLEKDLDLSNLKIIEFYISLSDIQSLESVVIKLGDLSLANYYFYSLSNLRDGWNIIRVPQDQFILNKAVPEFSWKDIKKIQFEVVSRPGTTLVANFDYLTVQNDISYLDKWKTVDDNFLSLGKHDNKIFLLARNEGALQATLSGISGDNFNFQASFIPKTGGAMGLFFRGNYGNNKGYYLLADGFNTNSCTLKKLGVKGWKELATTDIANFVFEKDEKYWLKVETKGEKITGFLSVDGESFTELFSVSDSEFSIGGMGISVFGRGYGFFDDFKFKQ